MPSSSVLLHLSEFLKFMSAESVTLCNHLILCHPPLLSPSIFPSISDYNMPLQWIMKAKVKSLSRVRLCDSIDCSLSGSSVRDFPGNSTGVDCHFLLQGTSRPRARTQVSHIVDRRFSVWATREDLLSINVVFGERKRKFCTRIAPLLTLPFSVLLLVHIFMCATNPQYDVIISAWAITCVFLS